MEKYLKQYDVFGFDLWDIILVSPGLHRMDYLRLLERKYKIKNLKERRIRIHNEIIEWNRKEQVNIGISLNDIYDALRIELNISKKCSRKIFLEEIHVLEKMVQPRETFLLFLKEIKKIGKKSFIIVNTDYISKYVVEILLHKYEIEQYADIFYTASNRDIDVYEKFEPVFRNLKKIGYFGNDKRIKEFIESFKFCNFIKYDYIYVPTVVEKLKKHRKLGQLYNNYSDCFDNCFLLGYSALSIFDNPDYEYKDESYFDGNLINMIDYLFAPFFLIFTRWMLEKCQNEEVDTLVYVYRDGYLIENIHSLFSPYMKKHINTKRIYLTRALCNIMYAEMKNSLYHSVTNKLTNSNMTVGNFIKLRLYVTDDDEYEEVLKIFMENGYTGENDLITEREKYIRFIKKLSPYFEKNLKNRISILEQYCRNTFEQSGRSAVFDVGYRGSACKFLKKFDLDVLEYHLFAKEEMEKNVAEGIRVQSLIKFGLDTEKKTKIINILTEDLLNAPEPTVIDIDYINNEIVLMRDQNWHPIKVIADIQEKILEYSEKFINIFGEYIWLLNFDIHNYFEFYVRFLCSAPSVDRMIFDGISFVDSAFMNANAENIYEKWINVNKNNFALNQIKVNNNVNIEYIERSAIRTQIFNWLKEKGYLPKVKSIWYKGIEISQIMSKGKKSLNNSICGRRIISEMENSLNSITNGMRYRLKPTIIVCGHIAAFDKGTCNYINSLSREMKDFDWLLLSECPHVKEETLVQKINIDYKLVDKVPMLNDYDVNVDMPLSYEVKKLIDSKVYLQEAVESMERRFPDMGLNYASYMAWYLYSYYNKVIDLYNCIKAPVSFLVWNEFTTMHKILKGVCREKDVKIMFMEFGVISGTFNFDFSGQMGESDVACHKDKFEKLEINTQDIQNAKETIDFIRINKFNRNVQPINNRMQEIKKQLKTDRPTILYLGQNDFEAGIFPYTNETKNYHSPFYKSSTEAARYIEQICKNNHFNFIYKPHPTIYSLYGCKEEFEDSTIVVHDVDIHDIIDVSDVCCTILSQAAYVALIRNKPVVMLGYMQLKDREFIYQLKNKQHLEKLILKAVSRGYTKEDYEKFVKHVARVNKYYSYDDLTEKRFSIGQPMYRLIHRLRNEFVCDANSLKGKSNYTIAICSQMPKGKYSGGRSHAWNIGEALAMSGHKVYFMANNEPVFKDAMEGQCGHGSIQYIQTNEYIDDLIDEKELDYVFLVPHRDINDVYYRKIWKFSISKNAKLILVNYESANWVKEYLGDELDERLWMPWIRTCERGCLILSSDLESQKYAEEFYTMNPKNTIFDYWYPPINSFVADNVQQQPIKKKNQIVAMIRLKDKYKGSFDILDMINEEFKGYRFVFIYGSGEQDEAFYNYRERLEILREQCGISYEIMSQITDYEKFQIISNSKLLLFPSYFEGFGTPPIEALYCQTDCVAYDLPVLRETCGSNIYYAEYGNVNDLRKKSLEALNNFHMDKDKKKNIYENANFNFAAEKLNNLLKKYEKIEWRDDKVRITN